MAHLSTKKAAGYGYDVVLGFTASPKPGVIKNERNNILHFGAVDVPALQVNYDYKRKPTMASDMKSGRKGLVASMATNLDTLIDYQEGTIVSREILKKPAGKVTLFAFSEGEGLSEHTSPYDALVYVLEGSTEITIAGETHQVSAGEIILIPASSRHALKSISAFKMMLIMV